MTFKEQLDYLPKADSQRVSLFVRQWAYDCAWWERYAVAEFGSHGEKCKASRKLTKIYLGY